MTEETKATEQAAIQIHGARVTHELPGGQKLVVIHGRSGGDTKLWAISFEAGGKSQAIILPEEAMRALVGIHAGQ